MTTFILNINGKRQRVTADPEMPLLWVLRDLLSLTGTKYGCGVGVCGACTVHEGRRAVRSCQVKISKAAGKSYTTIEGLSVNGDHRCLSDSVCRCGTYLRMRRAIHRAAREVKKA